MNRFYVREYWMAFAACFLIQVSYAQKPCAEYTGASRRECLEREAERTQREADKANAKAARLNKRMEVACDAADALDRAARLASRTGEVSRNKPFEYGGKVWTSVRSVTRAATRERENCEDARQRVEKSSR